ncbi:hypothetical protein SAMN05421812_13054, partial [Asanoa hainanensis]
AAPGHRAGRGSQRAEVARHLVGLDRLRPATEPREDRNIGPTRCGPADNVFLRLATEPGEDRNTRDQCIGWQAYQLLRPATEPGEDRN